MPRQQRNDLDLGQEYSTITIFYKFFRAWTWNMRIYKAQLDKTERHVSS